MFIHYVKELLNAEDGLSASQKERLSARIECWSKDNQVGDPGEIHRVLDDWIEGMRNGSKFLLRLDRKAGEGNTHLIDLIADPKSPSPPEILMAQEEQRYTGVRQARDFLRNKDGVDQETRGILEMLLNKSSEDEYEIAADEDTIKERVALLRPRLRDGKLLVPKRVASIRFDAHSLRIEYLSGYADDKVNRALALYAQGKNNKEISGEIGVSRTSIYNWLHERMGLPNLYKRLEHEALQKRVKEVRNRYKPGRTQREMARLMGCSLETVKRYLHAAGIKKQVPIYEINGEISPIRDKSKLYAYPKLWESGGALPGRDYWLYERIIKCLQDSQRRIGRGASRNELLGTFPPCERTLLYYIKHLENAGFIRKSRRVI